MKARAGHVEYQLCGTAAGFRRYLLDAGTLQLLLVCPLPAQTATASSMAAVALGNGMQSSWGTEQHPQSRSDAMAGEAVGRVAVPLHGLAGCGEADGLRLYGASA